MYDDARVFPQERFDDRGQDRRNGFGASDLDLSRGWIGQKRDVPYSLLQFIEGRMASLEKRMAVHRRLDPMRMAIEQSHAKRAFKIRNDVRNGRLGDAKLRGGLRHAASLGHRVEHMQIAQPEPPADLILPIRPSSHR